MFPIPLFMRIIFHLQIIFEFGYLGAILFLAAFWWLLNLRFDNAGRATHAATLAVYAGYYFFHIHCGKVGFSPVLGFYIFT